MEPTAPPHTSTRRVRRLNQIVGQSRSYTYKREVLNRTHQTATRRLAESLVVFL